MAGCTAALEYLDHDHSTAATWAGIRGWRLAVIGRTGVVGLRLRLRNIEQLTSSANVLGPAAIGEQAIMADAMKPAGQHVDEETADELVGGERHHFGPLLLLGPVVFPFECDPEISERDEAAVADGDAVGIARQVGQHRFRATERPLRVDHPLGLP